MSPSKLELTKELLSQFENQARNGQFAELLQLSSKLNFKKLPDKHRLALANLFRRAQAPKYALLSLAPFFKETKPREPTPAEVAEYSVSLFRIGLRQEASTRLQKIKGADEPKSLLYQCFCLFSQWDYEQSLPLLKEYIELEEDEYQKWVGKVNLAAALVLVNNPEAPSLIAEIQSKAKAKDWSRLYLNSHEIQAQWHINQDDFASATSALNKYSELLPKNKKLFESFFYQKWSAILQARKENNLTPLNKFAKNMSFSSHWETHRDLDFHRLKVQFNNERFQHLYFGSPFEGYRKKLIKTFNAIPKSEYMMNGKQKRMLDLSKAQESGEVLFRPGKNLHKLMLSLTSDFYRPTPLGRVFSEVYTGEHFDVYSSPTKVHQLMKRFRQALQNRNIPVEVNESQGNYKLEFKGDIGFIKILGEKVECKEEAMILELRRGLDEESFSRKNVESVLDVSAASANRLIRWGLDNGYVEQSGFGPKSKYILKVS